MTLGIEVKKPINVLKKTLKLDFKEFSKAVMKGGAHIALGNWDSLTEDGVDLVTALGVVTGPGEVAWLLVYRAMYNAMTTLVAESVDFNNDEVQKKSLRSMIDSVLAAESLTINKRFFDAPESSPLLPNVAAAFAQWLSMQGLNADACRMISERMPTYFAMSLHQEWITRSQEYATLRDRVDTPFTQANERAHAWLRYSAWLVKQVDEPMFNEPFGLRQVFVPPRAYFVRRASIAETASGGTRSDNELIQEAIDLQKALNDWIAKSDPDDAIRLISGGPGSGKSSCAKIFASDVAKRGQIDVLFVPLHHFDPSNDLVEAVGKFVQLDGFALNNPLLERNQGRRILIIFDGLDELAMQGKVAAKTAQDFVREVQRKVERLNQQSLWLQVLISGRELVMQQSEADFRKDGQILHLLPYFVNEDDQAHYHDPRSLLHHDQRQTWWRKYGAATGVGYASLPAELNKPNLTEITSQPLLNYLVALSLRRGKLKFSADTNLNAVYSDLLKAIYERGWSKRQHASIQGLDEKDFCRVLEEIALATWHGDGRTTTIREIKAHCDSSGLNVLLDRFESQLQGDAQTKVTQLLTAFYFRQSGHNAVGDNTFEFTHKSFGEYLTAKRIVREMQLMRRKLTARKTDPDEGWDEREALHRWVLICGPTPIDEYLLRFVFDELALEYLQDSSNIADLQDIFCKLFEVMLRNGLPMERISPRLRFVDERARARNAEAALLICINGLARLTGCVSQINWHDEYTFGDWLVKTCGRSGGFMEYPLLRSLSYLDLQKCWLNSGYLWKADFEGANLAGANLAAADCRYSNFKNANLNGACLAYANLHQANFTGARMRDASFTGVSLNLSGESDSVHQQVAGPGNFIGADLCQAEFDEADLRFVKFNGASLQGASFTDALLTGADFTDANIEEANFTGADCRVVDLAKNAARSSIVPKRRPRRKPKVS